MIKLKTLTVKNFMSVGNTPQTVNFDQNALTLVLGENLDLGGDGSRNGTGKTTIINALSYALYGQALTNIKKDNLINKTNNKSMLVSLDFSIGETEYRVERGRKPNTLRFFINHKEEDTEDDSAQGDSRETQYDIENALGMSHDMFRHIVALNTYSQPFLSLRANDQRDIIEQLLGITALSEKAEKVKEVARATKNDISQENMRISAVTEANSRIEEQIQSLKKRSKLWNEKKEEDVLAIAKAIEKLSHVDIDAEIENHRLLEVYNTQKSTFDNAKRWVESIAKDKKRTEDQAETLTKEIEKIKDHRCHACGQELHDEKHAEILNEKTESLEKIQSRLSEIMKQQEEYQAVLDTCDVPDSIPTVFYKKLEQAYEHQSSLTSLYKELETRNAEVDPYIEQIEDMKTQAIQEISYDHLNYLTRLHNHQDFLIKLLTNKDSFIRKKIINQNLSYLNSRLSHYLENIGLPHNIVFQNDLSVEITELGRDLDFDNLSRGERNRLILSLSWAFRDLWESLYGSINLLFIDELIDSGMDTSGVENSLTILEKMTQERKKAVWLVSHREDLIDRVENVLNVVKTNGFTQYGLETMQ